MKKLFDWGHVKNTLSRMVFAALLIIIFSVFIMIFLSAVNGGIKINDFEYIGIYSKFISVYSFVLATFLGSLILPNIAFRFTRDKKLADFVYSLPITRRQVFLSALFAALIMQLIVLAVVTAVSAGIVMVTFGIWEYTVSIFINLLIFYSVSMVLIGAASVAAGLSGRAFPQAAITLALVAVPAFLQISRHIIILTKTYKYLAVIYKPSLYVISNVFYYISGSRINYWAIAASAILAFVYFAAGAFIYQKRTGESSGQPSKNKAVDYIVKGILAFVLLDIAAIYFVYYNYTFSKDIFPLAIYIGLALIIMYVYDLYVNRKFLKKSRNLYILLITTAVVLTVNWAVDKRIETEYLKHIDADRVESVSIITDNRTYSMNDGIDYSMVGQNLYMASKVKIDDRQLINDIVYANNNLIDNDFHFSMYDAALLIRFNYKSGRHVYRYVPVSNESEDSSAEDSSLFMRIIKNEKYYEALLRNIPSKSIIAVDITGYEVSDENYDKTMEIYEIFREEYEKLSDEEKDKCRQYTYNEDVTIYGSLTVYSRYAENYLSDRFYITQYTPNAANALMQMANMENANGIENAAAELEKITQEKFYRISYDGKMILSGYMPDDDTGLVGMLKKYGYHEPNADGNIIKIYHDDLFDSKFIFLGIDDAMLAELDEIYNAQQEIMDKMYEN